MNREEMLRGSLYGLVSAFWLGWWSILISIACSFLYALGGGAKIWKGYRRYGIPALLSYTLHNWPICMVTFILSSAILHIGYGVRDPWDGGDPGSPLGNFFYSICPKYHDLLTHLCLICHFWAVYLILQGVKW